MVCMCVVVGCYVVCDVVVGDGEFDLLCWGWCDFFIGGGLVLLCGWLCYSEDLCGVGWGYGDGVGGDGGSDW